LKGECGMAWFTVKYLKTILAEEEIEADSAEEAAELWESESWRQDDDDLFFIEDEDGDQFFLD